MLHLTILQTLLVVPATGTPSHTLTFICTMPKRQYPVLLSFCNSCQCAAVQAAPVSGDSAPKKGSIQKWENGFQLERLAMGKPDGKLAKPGKKVVVRYRGSLQNGKVFDETKGNKTFSFRLGEAAAPSCLSLTPSFLIGGFACA